MKYQSKKDPSIFATEDSYNEKSKTTILVYETGDKKGKSVSVSSTTLKRWWKKVDDNPLNIDMEQVNKPYKSATKRKYIPKPQSVIEYEENKKKARRKTLDFTMPENYEVFGDMLAKKGIIIKKVNTGYISLPDNTKLKLLTNCIGILASNDVAEQLSKRGIISRPCIEKGTPFRFDIASAEDYDKMWEALVNV